MFIPCVAETAASTSPQVLYCFLQNKHLSHSAIGHKCLGHDLAFSTHWGRSGVWGLGYFGIRKLQVQDQQLGRDLPAFNCLSLDHFSMRSNCLAREI